MYTTLCSRFADYLFTRHCEINSAVLYVLLNDSLTRCYETAVFLHLYVDCASHGWCKLVGVYVRRRRQKYKRRHVASVPVSLNRPTQRF